MKYFLIWADYDSSYVESFNTETALRLRQKRLPKDYGTYIISIIYGIRYNENTLIGKSYKPTKAFKNLYLKSNKSNNNFFSKVDARSVCCNFACGYDVTFICLKCMKYCETK